jgi:hypothetical protein
MGILADAGAPPRWVEVCAAMALVIASTWSTAARAASHQVCLDFELGPQQARSKADFAAVPRINCIPTCGSGESNETNWGNALRRFILSASEPSLGVIAGMLSAVHAHDWYPSGDQEYFVENLDFVLDPDHGDYFGDPDVYDDWLISIDDWGISSP